MNLPATSLGAIALLLCAAGAARAQEAMTLSDLESKNPRRLTRDELQQMLPEAKVTRHNSRTGNTAKWTNTPGGKMYAASDNRMSGLGISKPTPGTWNISDAGQWCVTIQWRVLPPEDWCAQMFQTSDGVYAAYSAGPEAKVQKYELVK